MDNLTNSPCDCLPRVFPYRGSDAMARPSHLHHPFSCPTGAPDAWLPAVDYGRRPATVDTDRHFRFRCLRWFGPNALCAPRAMWSKCAHAHVEQSQGARFVFLSVRVHSQEPTQPFLRVVNADIVVIIRVVLYSFWPLIRYDLCYLLTSIE